MTTTFHLDTPAGQGDRDTAKPGRITATRLKVSMLLNPSELVSLAAPEGKPRVVIRVTLPGRTVTADVAAKSLRKVQAAIRETGADNVVIVLQGHLVADDKIEEAGLTAQAKVTKPA